MKQKIGLYLLVGCLFFGCTESDKKLMHHLEVQKNDVRISIDIDMYDSKGNCCYGKLIVTNLSNSAQDYCNAWVSLLVNDDITVRPYVRSMASVQVDQSAVKISPNESDTLMVYWPLEQSGKTTFKTVELKFEIPNQ